MKSFSFIKTIIISSDLNRKSWIYLFIEHESTWLDQFNLKLVIVVTVNCEPIKSTAPRFDLIRKVSVIMEMLWIGTFKTVLIVGLTFAVVKRYEFLEVTKFCQQFLVTAEWTIIDQAWQNFLNFLTINCSNHPITCKSSHFRN